MANASPLVVLRTSEPIAKAAAARNWHAALMSGDVNYDATLPDTPARPDKPALIHPSKVKKRGLGTPEGRGALLHAIAHIELNAIDLAADMVARFGQNELILDKDRADFARDWSQVGDDEARHFLMLSDRLVELGLSYGDMPAHNGLWEAAQDTSNSFAARLAIAPLVLEARGLDVTPGMIQRLKSVGDQRSAKILQTIYDEEIAHVATGAKWFQYVASHLGESPEPLFHRLVREYFKGRIKGPFNDEARLLAGFGPAYYSPLAA